MDETLTTYERNQALYAHLSGLLAITGLPFAHIVGPLVFYLMARNTTSTFALDNAREALNFQITSGIVMLAAIVAYVVAFFSLVFRMPLAHDATPSPAFFTGLGAAFVFLAIALLYMLFDFICVIVAAVAVSKGETYRYPLSIRFVSR
jgi:uncharacterized Tic20 family protein